jgi:hypothetical protein
MVDAFAWRNEMDADTYGAPASFNRALGGFAESPDLLFVEQLALAGGVAAVACGKPPSVVSRYRNHLYSDQARHFIVAEVKQSKPPEALREFAVRIPTPAVEG